MSPRATSSPRWLIALHLSQLGILVPIPFLNIVLPITIWLSRRSHDELIDRQGRHVINFQISLLIYLMVGMGLLLCVLTRIAVYGLVGLVGGLIIYSLICTARGLIAARQGQLFAYPLSIVLLPPPEQDTPRGTNV